MIKNHTQIIGEIEEIHAELDAEKFVESSQHTIENERLNLSKQEQESVSECNCKRKILIVDDNMFNLIPLELLLKKKMDIDVEKAFNG